MAARHCDYKGAHNWVNVCEDWAKDYPNYTQYDKDALKRYFKQKVKVDAVVATTTSTTDDYIIHYYSVFNYIS